MTEPCPHCDAALYLNGGRCYACKESPQGIEVGGLVKPSYFDCHEEFLAQHHQDVQKLQDLLGPFLYADCEGLRNYRFGSMAGPSYRISHLCHELAHLCELEESELPRVYANGYGFSIRTVNVLGTLCQEPATTQISERECRVAGIEWRLLNVLGYAFSVSRFASIMNTILPDALLVPKPRLPTLSAWVEASHKAYPLEALISRFKRNMGILSRRDPEWVSV